MNESFNQSMSIKKNLKKNKKNKNKIYKFYNFSINNKFCCIYNSKISGIKRRFYCLHIHKKYFSYY